MQTLSNIVDHGSLEYPDTYMEKGHAEEGFTLFFVLKGWLNGMDINGQAKRSGDGMGVLEDGWYYLLDDGNPDGYGPFDSDREAITEARDKLTEKAQEAFRDRVYLVLGNQLSMLLTEAETLGLSRRTILEEVEEFVRDSR